MANRIAIIDGFRTPFIKAWSEFKDTTACELGRIVVKELIERTELDADLIDEVIIGNVGTPNEAANPAKVIALYAGIPQTTSAYTVSRNCISGIQAISEACEKIRLKEGEIFIAGGTESMSNYPLLFGKKITDIFQQLFRAKTIGQRISAISKIRPAQFKPIIALELGLTDPVCGLIMGKTAEILAKDFGLSREAQDKFALMSHQRASSAIKSGRLKDEIIPVVVGPKYKKTIMEDNGVRHNQTMEALAKLRTIFERGEYATLTAGNSSQVSDGASAVLLTSEEKAKALGYEPLGYIRSYAYAGCEPARMGLGPSFAVPKALKKARITLKDIQLLEINEAFASVVLANQIAWASKKYAQEKLGLSEPIGEMNMDITNVNGGAIALGHPVGASGTRLVITILKEMRRRNLNLGLVTLCAGGGQGGAMVLERE